IISLVFCTLSPYKNLKYVFNALDIIKDVIIYKNVQTKCQIYLIIAAFVVENIRMCVFAYLPLSNLKRLIYVDHFYIVLQTANFNVYVIGFFEYLMGLIYIYKFHLHFPEKIIRLLDMILYGKVRQLAIYPTYKNVSVDE